jgi:hypothetical protein
MITGVVEAINLNDESDAVNSIWASIQKGGRNLVKCTPLNMHVRTIPVLGEIVYLVKAPSDVSSGVVNGESYYYTSIVGIHKNINHNLMQPYNELSSQGDGISFQSINAGISNSSTSGEGKIDFGTGFKEVTTISQIQPFLGDTIIEGRFGQSIRFGYTPQGVRISNNKVSSVKIEPSWKSTKPESPITIIRNGSNKTTGYNKFTIEDVNDDLSSLWLTDQQTINISLSNKLPITLGTLPTLYKSPQLIGNSDRIILNAKADNIILSAKKDIAVLTSKHKTSIDLIVECIQILAQGTFPTAVGPTGPHPRIVEIISKLKQGI